MPGNPAKTAAAKGAKPRRRRRPSAPRRSAARVAAVQALYQIDVTSSTAERVLDEFVRFRLESGGRNADESVPVGADRALFLDIVRGVTARGEVLDDILGAAMTERWTVARLDPVLRAMLRAGVYELFAREDIPAKVAISEYVDVAHAFFEDREPGLVNGILDRVARNLRGDGVSPRAEAAAEQEAPDTPESPDTPEAPPTASGE